MGKIEERAKCSLANHFDESRVEFNKEHRNMREWEYGYCQGATEQKAIDIKKFKQWFTKWWESNEYIPLDVCLKSIDKAMEE